MDPSSTYRFGKQGQQEAMWRYCAFSLFRDSTGFAYRQALKKKEFSQFVGELLTIIAFIVLLLWIDWQWFLWFYLPTFYFGWFLAHMENYYEHYRAIEPDNKYANSVSYYGVWYNICMFNEGYHQEHHIHPGKHWSERPVLRERHSKNMQENGAYQARFPPLLGFFD